MRFSEAELTDTLSGCSNVSVSGLDHLKWSHIKRVIRVHSCVHALLAIADACLVVGHWLLHFKDSLLVIIPKPGKLSYSTPKAFWPIVLLNTLGKLIEKMVSNRLQFDSVKYDQTPSSSSNHQVQIGPNPEIRIKTSPEPLSAL